MQNESTTRRRDEAELRVTSSTYGASRSDLFLLYRTDFPMLTFSYSLKIRLAEYNVATAKCVK